MDMDNMDMDNMDMDTWTTQAHILTTRLCGVALSLYRTAYALSRALRENTHVRDVGCGRVGAQMLAIARAS